MKKIVSLISIVMICSIFCVSAFGEFTNPSIIDEAGYLYEDELNEISNELDNIRIKYDFDVAIYTEEEFSSFDAQNSADDIFDYNGYGAGPNSDGILLYICSGTRQYHLSTHGYGISAFNGNGLAYIEEKIVPLLQVDNYYGAMKAYVECCEELLEMAEQGTPYNKKQYSVKYVIGVVLFALIVPIIVAYIMMKKKLKKMKTAVKQDYAANYMKPNSLHFTLARDMFLYSTITKTEKAKSDSDTHTSSSGRTHGGSGGSF